MQLIRRALVILLSATTCAMASPMATAAARVGLLPGTKLFFRGGGECSLGFLATNDFGDRLGVTAGHCPSRVDQEVVSENGTPIGRVVHITTDEMADHRYGAALIQLYRSTYTADAYFTTFGNPSVGDYVKKYGARTEKTDGTIVSVTVDPDEPEHSEMQATLVGLPGDSGSAWVGSDGGSPKLLGLNIGYSHRRDGGYGNAIGFPIRSLIATVQANSPKWGPGFIPVGP
jgi:hypothetical protein